MTGDLTVRRLLRALAASRRRVFQGRRAPRRRVDSAPVLPLLPGSAPLVTWLVRSILVDLDTAAPRARSHRLMYRDVLGAVRLHIADGAMVSGVEGCRASPRRTTVSVDQVWFVGRWPELEYSVARVELPATGSSKPAWRKES